MEKMLGVMIDCSRNAVMSVESLKRYLTILSRMGYNTVMLYTEDTYEVNGEPLFGYMRGRYSKKELQEIDAFCGSLGMELIPCIQTLAHLNGAFRWEEYRKNLDCNDILLVGDDRTYRLIENMISTAAECFSGRRIHIGMDEAHMVGLGKYLDEHGYSDRYGILFGHLKKVCSIAEKYGFRPMIWSDMFFRLVNHGKYYGSGIRFDDSLREKLPEGLSLVYWDYYHDDEQIYLDMLESHKQLSQDIVFAGGAWCWSGFAPDNLRSMRRNRLAAGACRKEGVEQVLITSWGDDGAECSKYAVLPALMYTAEVFRGNENMDSIKRKFRDIVGADFDAFLLLDKADRMKEEELPGVSKQLLYNDLFCGVNDYMCCEEYDRYFEKQASELANAPGKGGYAYLFDTMAALCSVLAVKSNLGRELRAVYRKGDREALKNAVRKLDDLCGRITAFHGAFERQWMRENKPFGFEVQDLRLGGLRQRAESCKNRLEKYLNGEIPRIEELEEDILESPHFGRTLWAFNFTANVVSHI